ncbi:MAG TPA: FAD-dependent oxidoreductase [Terriglobales bacterium]|nr:FAD-dependent oxidoreductase [Terriglobales bacterium]
MKTFDAIIAGAGIIGVSIALELRKRGLNVLVLDRGQPGDESSTAGAGMLAATEVDGPSQLLVLARQSAVMFPDFVAEIQDATGLTIDFNRRGAICLGESIPAATPLTDEELVTLGPALSSSSLPASFVAEDFVDPRTLMPALVAAAKHQGVHVHGGSEVTSLLENSKKVTGVATAHTQFSAPIVVNCCGAWAKDLSPGVPTRPVKGHMLALLPATPHPIRHVIRNRETDVYLVPRRDGIIAVGSTVEETGFDKRVDADTIQRLHQLAADILPELGEARIHQSWTGLRPGTPDKFPILGPGDIAGYFIATGHYRNGILLAPATAKAMADLITQAPTDFDLSPFVPSRFAPVT